MPLDRIQRESLALRKMLNAIYGKHIYKKAGIRFVQGPICRPSEAVNMQKRRNVKSADVSSRYMNTLPSNFLSGGFKHFLSSKIVRETCFPHGAKILFFFFSPFLGGNPLILHHIRR